MAPYWSLLNSQWNALILHSISWMMCGGSLPFKYPVQHWQLGSQEELCFGTNLFWSSSNFKSCQYLFFFSGSVVGFRPSAYSTPKPHGAQVPIGAFCWALQIVPLSLAVVSFNTLSWPAQPKSYCLNYFLFYLFKGCHYSELHVKTFFFLGHLIERIYNLTGMWNTCSPETHNA